ncbi:hypothetical protein SFBM_0664 [Candidatus Arthromitus sp. SFB-mouse-Japan]|nr:hypothetical protein SFBM_0664 [Candidatus Arthromitus sp. SFB-mouse-Japan]BAK79766.1 lipolytic protein G-D-S-L family [Candidatus Arthromitus sp. SFB-mouse-Yit]
MLTFLRSVISTEWDGDKKEVVFLGDSIIRDYDLDRFFPKIKTKLFNCGVSGITTQGLHNIIKQGVIRHKPSTIVILVGTNDMSEENSKRDNEIIDNIAKLIIDLKIILNGVNIVFISILPCDEDRYGKNSIAGGGRTNERIEKLNSVFKEFEKYYKDYIFVDAFKELSDDNGNLIKQYTHDGLHLNVDGYEKLTKELNPIIEKLIKK